MESQNNIQKQYSGKGFPVGHGLGFQPGQSGNPGGRPKGAPSVPHAYARMGQLSSEELEAYECRNIIEEGVKNALKRAADADDWQAAHAALKEIADRLDGKAVQRKEVEINVNIEQKREIQIKAYCLVFENKSEEEALDEIRRIYAAQNAIEREQVIRDVLEADEVAYEDVREQAEAMVLGGR